MRKKSFEYLDRLYHLGVRDMAGAEEYLINEYLVDPAEIKEIIEEWEERRKVGK